VAPLEEIPSKLFVADWNPDGQLDVETLPAITRVNGFPIPNCVKSTWGVDGVDVVEVRVSEDPEDVYPEDVDPEDVGPEDVDPD
jgi:hypothetical protein